MTSKKIVTWKVQVNLGNDEYIELVVTGEAETADDGQGVAVYTAGQLLGIANTADKATAEMIRAYVGRVFGPQNVPAKEPWIPKITKSSWEKAQEEKAAKQDLPVCQPPDKAPTTEEQAKEAIARCVKPPAPAPDPAPSAPPKTEASAPAERLAAPQPAASAPDGEVCERCGAAVTKSQAKLSQLFMNKTLCKTCMDSNGGA